MLNKNEYPLLSRYISDKDLPHYSIEELQNLAEDLRKFIIKTLSDTGGHLASNLGVVELTIALLCEYNFLQDRIIFDVGHQAYPYKILTDRLESFSKLRQNQGISGFPKTCESPYDYFNTGHASTSISAILGFFRAERLLSENDAKSKSYIALIGDGSLTGGLAFEALNNISPDDDILIIFNDNQMSIDKNIGNLSSHFAKIRLNSRYLRTKKNIKKYLLRFPVIGSFITDKIVEYKRQLRRKIGERACYFDNLGLRYYGPVNGHDIEELRQHLAAVKQLKGPRVLHVCTCKGRGYVQAENKPQNYHGVSPNFVSQDELNSALSASIVSEVSAKLADSFNPAEIQLDSRPASSLNSYSSYTECFGQEIIKLMYKNSNIFAITAAMPSGTGLLDFASLFPQNFCDVGIAEAHALTFAAGIAAAPYNKKKQGRISLVPVVAVYSTFLQRAVDQLIHDICLQNLHVVLALDRAGVVGADGETHQGLYDIVFLQSLPNLQAFSPSSYQDLAFVLDYAVNKCEGAVSLRYPRGASSYEKSLALAKSGGYLQNIIKIPAAYDLYELALSNIKEPDLNSDDKQYPKTLIICEGLAFSEALRGVVEYFDSCLSLTTDFNKLSTFIDFSHSYRHLKIDILSLIKIKPLNYMYLKNLLINYDNIITLEHGVKAGGLGEHLISALTDILGNKKIKILACENPIIEQNTVDGSRRSAAIDYKAVQESLVDFYLNIIST